MTLPARMKRSRASIYDVAKRAGVSHQTVTRVLRGFEGIRPETRRRVETALAELEYTPNPVARALATNRSHRIGALVYELLQLGPGETIQGAANAARDAGYVLDIVAVDPFDDASVEQAFTALRQQDLAGILAFAPMDLLADRLNEARFRVPVLIEDDTAVYKGTGRDNISRQGMDLLVGHLAALGHREIAHVSGPLSWAESRNRRSAFKRSLRVRGLEAAAIVEGAWTAESGYRAARVLDLDAATAVVAANDQTALGVLRGLAERGVSVPGDVSVTGFDDMPESAYFAPPLTTIRPDYAGRGRAFTARMLAELDVGHVDTEPPRPVELITRESTGRVRPAGSEV